MVEFYLQIFKILGLGTGDGTSDVSRKDGIVNFFLKLQIHPWRRGDENQTYT